MSTPRTTLDHWLVLQTVVEAGGFARAAERLHRSQSSISYAVHKLETQLGVELLRLEGRRARLTETGRRLLEQARQLLRDARELEDLARRMKEGREPEVRMTVDSAYPTPWLIHALQRFSRECDGTRVRLDEVVMSGVDEAVLGGEADLAIGILVPSNLLGDMLAEIEFVAVAHPGHPLHGLKRPLSVSDLRREILVVVSDSGVTMQRDEGWLGAEQKWSVANLETALAALRAGLGFGWLPRHMIQEAVRSGELKPLPLRHGRIRRYPLYLIYGRRAMGPAASLLARILKDVSRAPLLPPTPPSRSSGPGPGWRTPPPRR